MPPADDLFEFGAPVPGWAPAPWAAAPTTLPPAVALRWQVEEFKHQVELFKAAAVPARPASHPGRRPAR